MGYQISRLQPLLCDCANAPPNHNCPDKPYNLHYQHAVSQLKAADLWVGNQNVQQWLQKVVVLSQGISNLHNTCLHSS